MRKLLRIACSKPAYFLTLAFSLVSLIFLTIAGSLEMFSLGAITKKGPDFFELFAPTKDNILLPTNEITKVDIEKRWSEVDPQKTGVITKEDAEKFISSHTKEGVIGKGLQIINSYIPIEKNIWYLVLAITFVAIFKAITQFSYSFSTKLLAIRVSRDLRQKYFEHIQSLPLSFYEEHNIGSLSSRLVNDAQVIADAINSILINYLGTPFTFLSTFVLCWLVSWKLSIGVFFGLPLLIVPIVLLAKKIKKISRQTQKKQEAFASVLIEFLSGIQTIKIFAREEFSLKKYTEQNNQMARLELRSARYDISSRPILHTVGIFSLVAVLLFGIYGLLLPLHEVLFYCGLLSCAYEPIKKFAEENARIQRGVAAAERMFEVIALEPQKHETEGTIDFQNHTSSIEFDNVYFGYGSDWVLQGVSFTAKKGEKVAIVGPTGSGKSTIALLLPRLYEVKKGEIRLDGRPLSHYTPKSLREKIAFVPQRPFLFYDTVHENIGFGKVTSRDEVKKASLQAHAEEFILNLEKGYDTILPEAGKTLSGGQQQRLAIARAFVKNSPIIVMDEATSSLDAISEKRIKDSLKSLKGDVTQIIIAHRLSTIEDADRIIYLDKGKKIAEGTKDELLQTCPQFKMMWEILYQAR